MNNVSLKDIEKQFQLIFENYPVGIILIDSKGEILDFNKYFLSLTGESSDFLKQIKHPLNVFNNEKNRYMRESFLNGKEASYEGEYTTITGKTLYVRIIGKPFFNNNNEFKGSILLVEDFSDYMKIKCELEKSEYKYRLMAETTNDAIYILSNKGSILECNKAACEMFGYSFQEMIGKHSKMLVPESYENKLREYMLKVLVANELKFELVAIKKNKEKFPIEIFTKLNDFKGEKTIIAYIHDITLSKKIEKQLGEYGKHLEREVDKRTKELKEINLEFERFTQSISHDMLASIRVIAGYSKALDEDVKNNISYKDYEYIKRIQATTDSINEMINGLLNYSRVSSSEINFEIVNLESLLNKIINHYHDDIIITNTKIILHKPMPIIYSNTSILIQIISNLISNAIKFVDKNTNPQIEIFTSENDKYVKLFIKDNGIGIPEEKHKVIFDMFERLHGEETYPGKGIGLSVVKKGAERLDSKISLESKMGEGSTFCLEFKK